MPEGEVAVYRWARSGQFESSRATLRQVRASRHGLSRTSVLTLEASSSLDGAGDSEVLVKDGSVVGLATSKQGETLAAISAPVLRQFLADARNPPYRGFARAGIAWQDLTNPALRSYLGLRRGRDGRAAHPSASPRQRRGDTGAGRRGPGGGGAQDRSHRELRAPGLWPPSFPRPLHRRGAGPAIRCA